MADWIIKDTTLRRIADKVRGLNDSSAKMLVKNIADNIPEKQDKNVSITENGTQTIRPDNGKILGDVIIETNVEGDNKSEQAKTINVTANGTQTVKPDTGKTLSQVTVITNVERSEVILQEKTVAPTQEQQQVRPDTGYNGLSQVTVEAILTEEKTVTPAATEFYVLPTTGKYLTRVKVNAVPAEEKTITSNGTYEPSDGKFISKVVVNVPRAEAQVKTVTVTENNKTTYVFPDEGKTLSHVVINTNVPGTDFTKVTAVPADVVSGKAFYDKNGSLAYGTMPQYNGEYFAGLYPPTISIADNTLMWEAVLGADGYKIYKQTSSSSYELIAEITATEYDLLNLAVGNYTLCVTAFTRDLETPNSNAVNWVKAKIQYTLTNTSLLSAPEYFTTNTPATITFNKAFGYTYPSTPVVVSAQLDSYSNGVLVLSSPNNMSVSVTANGVKDTSATITAGSYKFKVDPTAIQSNLTEDINFTANGASYTALSAYSSGNIDYRNGDTVVQAYNGTTWSDSRTITVTSTAHVSADFLLWFNNAMEQKLGSPVIKITGAVVSWTAVANATSYEIRFGVTTLATTSGTSFDISTYGKTMGAGSHNITVIAKANGFADSSASNAVTYTVYRLTAAADFRCYAGGSNYEVFSWDYMDSHATGGIVYEETSQGVYTQIAEHTRDGGSVQLPYSGQFTIGAHTYVCKLVDSTGVYDDSEYSNAISVSVYALTWNVAGASKPTQTYALGNASSNFYMITPDSGNELPEAIEVQGLSTYTWSVGSSGNGTFSFDSANINAATYASGIVVTINATKQATITAGTYVWTTDPTLSSTLVEANFNFTSGGTSYTKLSSGNNDFIKYNDTTVYSMSGGATWTPATAQTITVTTEQNVPQDVYNFFFGGNLLKQLSQPVIAACGQVMFWNKVENATQYSFSVTQGSNTYDFGTIYDIHNFVEAKAANYNFNNKTISLTKGTYNFKAPFSGNTVRIMFTNSSYFEIFCGAGITLSHYEAYAGYASMITNSSFDTPISFRFRDGSRDTGEPYVEKFLLGQGTSPSSFTEITPEEFKAGITLNFDL